MQNIEVSSLHKENASLLKENERLRGKLEKKKRSRADCKISGIISCKQMCFFTVGLKEKALPLATMVLFACPLFNCSNDYHFWSATMRLTMLSRDASLESPAKSSSG
ncbi:hypothetical protein MRX96_003293 [Rhipicephalus microplus]